MLNSHQCKIVRHKMILPDLADVTVDFPGIGEIAAPGQFVHVACGGATLLRRPFAVCDADGDQLRFVAQVKGEGTQLIAQKQAGDTLDILAPLGRGFKIKPRHGEAVLIGGGIGIFPLLFLARRLSGRVTSILGFRNKSMIALQDEFKRYGDLIITTDDGSYGLHGLVTDALLSFEKPVGAVYACGPTPMLRAVKQAAAQLDISDVQLSLEQRMGCGIGMCAVCVCKVRGEYSKICAAGPVFNAEEVDL